MRLGPDLVQEIAGLGLDQRLQRQHPAAFVGKGVIGAAVQGEIAVEFEAAPHVAGDEEGRPVVVGRQPVGVVAGLPEGGAHVGVPARAAATAGRRCRAEHVRLDDRLVLGVLLVDRPAALLGLQNEGVALVEIDAQRLAEVTADGEFEAIAGLAVRRLWRRQVEGPGQLGQEQDVVGAFGPALAAAPAIDECLGRHLFRLRL